MLNLYMALGAVGTRYNPLINYKWSTLPVSSDYITDGIELWDDDLAVVGVFDANNYTEKLGNNTYRVVYDGTDIKQVKITGIYDTSSLYMIDIEIITTISGSVKVDTSSSGQAVLLSTGKHYYNPANADASIYRGAKPTDVTFKINSIQKVIQEPNKRYLRDSGTSKSPMALYSGAGVKLNGLDQSVITGTFFELGLSGIKTKTTTLFTLTESFSGYAFNTGTGYNQSGMRISVVSGIMYIAVNRSTDNYLTCAIQTSGTYAVVFDNSDLKVYENGILIGTQILSVSTYTLVMSEKFNIGSNSENTLFGGGVISNSILIDGIALTPTQIAYQYNNPEKFLYHTKQTDGTYTHHSEILSEAEIANVVAHFPMNETDEYVRNMMGYNEGINAFDDATESNNLGGVITLTEDGFTASSDGTAESNIRPAIKFPVVDIGLYLLRIDTEVISGSATFRIYDGASYTFTDVAVVDGYQEFIIDIKSNTCFLSYDGLNNIFDISVIASMKKLSSTYPIQNFTASCRDEAINLPYGRQNALLERDSLGVEIGRSGYYEMDGTQVPALRLPMTDTELWSGNFFQIEMVISRELIVDNIPLTYTIQDIAKKGHALYVNRSFNSAYMGLLLYDGSGVVAVSTSIDENLHHLVFTVNATEMYMTVDGVKGTAVAHSFVPSGLSFAASIQTSPMGQLRLFKIHKVYQDETKLFDKAVNAGLLN